MSEMVAWLRRVFKMDKPKPVEKVERTVQLFRYGSFRMYTEEEARKLTLCVGR